MTSMVQIADLCSYSLRRFVEQLSPSFAVSARSRLAPARLAADTG